LLGITIIFVGDYCRKRIVMKLAHHVFHSIFGRYSIELLGDVNKHEE
jgi:hypothetical protein